MCVSRVAKGRQIGGWVEGGWREWGGVLQCVKETEIGGKCVKGAVSICFAYICGGGRRSMVDRWVGSAGMTHGRSCSLLLYQHRYARRPAPVWRRTAHRNQKTEHRRREQGTAPRDTGNTTRTFSLWILCADLSLDQSTGFPWSRGEIWLEKQKAIKTAKEISKLNIWIFRSVLDMH